MVLLSHNTKKGWTSEGVTSAADFRDYQRQNTSFEQLAGWTQWSFNLTSDGPPDRAMGGLVTWNFFQALDAETYARPRFRGAGIAARVEPRRDPEPLAYGRAASPRIQISWAEKSSCKARPTPSSASCPPDFQFPLMGIAQYLDAARSG